MKIDRNGVRIEEYEIFKSRRCKRCNVIYDLSFVDDSQFCKPYDYSRGFEKFCLSCWLLGEDNPITEKTQVFIEFQPVFPSDHSTWYDTKDYLEIVKGDLNLAYKDYIKNDCHIVVLPISRLHVDKTIFLPSGVLIYPKGILNFDKYKLDDNSIFDNYNTETYEDEDFVKLQSFLSGITIKDCEEETFIVLPISFEWESIYKCTHSYHMNFIRTLSEIIDEAGLKYLKYKNSNLDYNLESSLPSYAGQLSSNFIMSSCLLINGKTNELRILGGNAYSHHFTYGVGLKIDQPEFINFPKNGEVGKVASHALTLYIQMIQTQSTNSRYVQALSLLEYLAYPKEFRVFKDVKKIIAKYVAKDIVERDYLYERFLELTGKKNKVTKEELGLRTLIVHIGGNIESLLSLEDREKVFIELDSYIRYIIDFMIKYSDMDYDDYFTNKVKDKYEVN